MNGKTYQVGLQPTNRPDAGRAAAVATETAAADITAQMPGVVLRILANVGDRVEAGQSLLVLEAMKMEVQVAAPAAGDVRHISVAVGDHVVTGQVLASIG